MIQDFAAGKMCSVFLWIESPRSHPSKYRTGHHISLGTFARFVC